MQFTSAFHSTEADDLPARIDVHWVREVESRARGNEGVEVRHHAVLPKETTAVPIMAEIDRQLTAKPVSKPPRFTDEQIREFLRRESKDFCDALTSDPEFARQEIQKRIKKLVLTPKDTPEGPVLEVSGDVALLGTGDVLVESPIQRISQQYIGISTPLAGIILKPAPLLATLRA